MIERRTEGSLAGLQEDNVVSLGIIISSRPVLELSNKGISQRTCLPAIKSTFLVVIIGRVRVGRCHNKQHSTSYKEILQNYTENWFYIQTNFYQKQQLFSLLGSKTAVTFALLTTLLSGTKRLAILPEPTIPMRYTSSVCSRSIVEEMPSVRGR